MIKKKKHKDECTDNGTNLYMRDSDNVLKNTHKPNVSSLKGIAETIYILRLALSKENLCDLKSQLLNSLDFTYISFIAKLHYVEPVVASVLQEVGIRDNRERHTGIQNDNIKIAVNESAQCNSIEQKAALQTIMSEFSTNKRRSLLFLTEVKNIQHALSEAGIWSCPVKGTAIMNLYPRADMRSMLDIDMIYDAKKQMEVQGVMRAMGYKSADIGKHRHDIYEKQPLFELEMHRIAFRNLPRDKNGMLIKTSVIERLQENKDTDINGDILILDKSWKKTKPNSKIGALTNEGNYLYNMRHIYNDYISYGTGLRSCMDCAVYLQAFGQTLDWNFIAEHASADGYAEFLAEFQSLSQKLLLVDNEVLKGGVERVMQDIETLDDKEKKIFWRCIRSGQKGNLDSKIEFELENISGTNTPGKLARVKYVASRIFVPKKYLVGRFPRAAHITALRPVLWGLRIIDSMKHRSGSNIDELKRVFRK